MRKPEAEKMFRSSCHDWAREKGIVIDPKVEPVFYDFIDWLKAKGRGQCLEFRSVVPVMDIAERWFAEEFQQTWGY